MPEKLDKKDTLLRILYYLLMIIFLGFCYANYDKKSFLYMEILTAYMLFLTIFRHIITYKRKPINKKPKNKVQIEDPKSAYIENIWEELKKN